MSFWEWIGLASVVVGGTVVICIAGGFLVILADGLWDAFAVWRTKRALARNRDLGAPPGA